MARAIEGVDWLKIQTDWCHGVTAVALAAEHDIAPEVIRARARRKKWISERSSSNSVIVKKAAQIAAKRAVTKAVSRITSQVEHSVDECIAESIALGRQFMSRARESVSSAEDSSVGSIATLGRTGVDLWRKSLGLDATGSNAPGCAINFSFTVRGAEQERVTATLDASPATPAGVTLDADEV